MLQAVPGDARQPVVGVERVDVAERPQVGADPVGERVDDIRQLLLGEVRRAGLDVDDPEAGLDLDHLGAGVVPAPGEDVGGHPAWARADTELADVDVHAAAVALTGLGER